MNRLSITPVAAAGIICIAIFLISTPISVNATTCIEPDYPVEEMTKINDMFLSQECVVAVEASSWGAIKSLMK